MRLVTGQKWVVTVLVTLALLASPCLSLALVVGTAPAHAQIVSSVLAVAHHRHDGHHQVGGGAAGHSHHPADAPEQQQCCKLCDASLSGRKDDAGKVFAVPRPASPEDEPAAISGAVVWDTRSRAHQIVQAPATARAADAATAPLYLTTGRFRI